MTTKREAAIEIVRAMLGPQVAEHMAKTPDPEAFCGEMGQLALDSVFGALWARPGLTLRDRSLVTLGILIALRATGELRFHIPAAMRNGLTQEELAEVMYHATAYAGFPAATSASAVASEIFAKS